MSLILCHQVFLFHRITSYNVCYTKLLRYGEYNGVRILSRKATEAMTKNQLGEGLPNFCWGCKGIKTNYGLGFTVDRITSYNVCYTKLLRTNIYEYKDEKLVLLVSLNRGISAFFPSF